MDKTMDFVMFKRVITKELGLQLDSYKDKRVQRRIDSLMRRHQIESYYDCWQRLLKDEAFKEIFLNHFTINTSEFFRNPNSFDYLNKSVLPMLLQKRVQLKIWSAACSIGAEPYSIAILLKEMNLSPHKYHILATDIDRPILEVARKGVYNKQVFARIDKGIQEKYFTNISNDYYQINKDIIRMVEFKYQDLLQEDFKPGWDLIVCRNLFIYLTPESKDYLTKKFSEALNPGGVLFLGNTEFIFDTSPYNLKKMEGSFYQRNK